MNESKTNETKLESNEHNRRKTGLMTVVNKEITISKTKLEQSRSMTL